MAIQAATRAALATALDIQAALATALDIQAALATDLDIQAALATALDIQAALEALWQALRQSAAGQLTYIVLAVIIDHRVTTISCMH